MPSCRHISQLCYPCIKGLGFRATPAFRGKEIGLPLHWGFRNLVCPYTKGRELGLPLNIGLGNKDCLCILGLFISDYITFLLQFPNFLCGDWAGCHIIELLPRQLESIVKWLLAIRLVNYHDCNTRSHLSGPKWKRFYKSCKYDLIARLWYSILPYKVAVIEPPTSHTKAPGYIFTKGLPKSRNLRRLPTSSAQRFFR
jgi:hypothetical protein